MEMYLKSSAYDYINLNKFIKEEFNDKRLIIKTPFKKDLLSTIISQIGFSKRQVTINNSELISLNFRLLNSNLPEYFAYCSYLSNNKTIPLCHLVDNLCDCNVINSSLDVSQKILRINFFRFFECLLFADLFEKVWEGDFLNNRMFIFKIDDNINYVGIMQKFEICKALYNTTLVSSKLISENNISQVFELNFWVDVKLAIAEIKKEICNIKVCF